MMRETVKKNKCKKANQMNLRRTNLGTIRGGICVHVSSPALTPSLRRAACPHLVCLNAKRKSAKDVGPDDDAVPPPAEDTVPAVPADVAAGKDVLEEEEELESEAENTPILDGDDDDSTELVG